MATTTFRTFQGQRYGQHLVDVEGSEFNLTVMTSSVGTPRKPRVYVDGEQTYEALGLGQMEEVSNTVRRQYWRELRELLQEALASEDAEALELETEGVTYKFSQRAGCSCGCSPGFVASRVFQSAYGPVTDLWVTKR